MNYLDRNEFNYAPSQEVVEALKNFDINKLCFYTRIYDEGKKSILSVYLSETYGIDEPQVLLGYGGEDILKQAVHYFLTQEDGNKTMLIPKFSWWYYKSIADVDKPALIVRNIKEMGLDCVVCIGGNGTQKTAAKLSAMGLNIVSVPKTIDNDIWGTDFSFGFDSAVSIATDAIDRLHSTASSHKRVMVIEVMGHKAGWIALYSGMAGGGDVILIPEIPYNIHRIGETILNRLKKGKPYSIVVVAEGIQTDGRKRAAEYIAQEIEYETGIETRETVLGYIQRGGSPTPFDRNLSTRMGGHATELIANGQFGRMITLKGNEIASAPLEEIAGKLKLVTEDNDLVVQGRRMGICFG